jgi:hypothetical protein
MKISDIFEGLEDWRVGVQSIPRTEKFKLKKIVVKTPGGKTYTFDNESEARRHFVDSWERIKAGELDGWFVDLNNTKEYNESTNPVEEAHMYSNPPREDD